MSNMSVRISPILIDRYAQALFDLAKEKKVVDEVFDDIMSLADLGDLRVRMNTLFESPQFNDADKALFIRNCFSGRVNDVLVKFMQLVLIKGRMLGLGQMLTTFLDKVNHDRGIWRAEIVTASPLNDDAKQMFDTTMEAFMRRRMEMGPGDALDLNIEFRVDPRVIGGVRFMCGNTLIDDTVRGKLDKVRADLMSVINQ